MPDVTGYIFPIIIECFPLRVFGSQTIMTSFGERIIAVWQRTRLSLLITIICN
jgi:hypothetical protein